MAKKKKPMQVAIEGELSIFTAGATRERLLDAFDTGADVDIDLSRITEIDSAGVQIMIAAVREAAARNAAVRFTAHSGAVLDIVDLCRLSDQFAFPLAATGTTP